MTSSRLPGRTSGGAPPWGPAALLPVLLAGCASLTPHRVPTELELRAVKAVEIDAIAAGAVVRHETSRGAEHGSGRRDPPRIALGLDTARSIATVLIQAGSDRTPFSFRRAGEPGDSRDAARLEVVVADATLASGEGPDPLTALWVTFRTRLSLPQSVHWLGPAWIHAADPRPRRLSEWEAEGGAPVRSALVALVGQSAPRLLADLGGGGASPSSPFAVEATSLGEGTPPDPAPGVRVELLSRSPGDGTGMKVAGALGGFVLGGAVGAFYGLGKCADGLGSGGGNELAAIVFAACAAVAMPVGALVGTVMGSTKGIELAAKHVAKEEAAWKAEHERKAAALGGVAVPAELAEAAAGASRALAAAAGAPERAPVALGGMMVRLVEAGGKPARAELELDLTLRGDGEGARERRLCLRGPGPLPTSLWLERQPGLLRAAVEAQLARGVALGLLGLEPRPGDGPCAKESAPPKP